MSKNSSHRDSESARAERRRADRERLRRAAQELLSSEGWARWVRVRSMFHAYSAGNCMLLAQQCHERGIVPQRIGGFRTWLKLGRCVRKGEMALRIFAPLTVSERDQRGQETGERRVFFKTAFVFELSQTEPLPGPEVLPLEPPSQPLSGDSHAHLIEPLRFLASSIGFSVSFQSIAGAAGGWCEPKGRRIVIDTDAPANAQVRTLIHECAHALGIDGRTAHRRPFARKLRLGRDGGDRRPCSAGDHTPLDRVRLARALRKSLSRRPPRSPIVDEPARG
jgi:hypothetical protein